MKTNRLMTTAALAALLLWGASCSNQKQTTEQASPTVQAADGHAMPIDSLLARAGSLAGQEVTIEGVCTHTCKHGATKIFLMGTDDTQTIRVEAGELGSFDTKCVHKPVRVTGRLMEQRLDEAYLQRWEERLKDNTELQHGTTSAGCESEKNARGETANTPEQRIADFRSRIARRQAEEGKPYLSFYYVVASHYDILASN